MRYVIGLLLVLLIAAALMALTYRGNAANARADRDEAQAQLMDAEEERDNLRDVLNTERERADRMTLVAEQYEQDKADAQATAERVIADLRDGNIRLQDKWRGCQAGIPPSFPGTAVADAEADDRAESASRIVRAAAECDAQVRGLQAIVIGDRQ